MDQENIQSTLEGPCPQLQEYGKHNVDMATLEQMSKSYPDNTRYLTVARK